jgi:hypothetical protein
MFSFTAHNFKKVYRPTLSSEQRHDQII